MTTNQTVPVTDEELDQMIWKLERDGGMTPKMLSLMRELREVRRAKVEPVAWTEKCEITNMQATGLYLRGFPDNSQGREIPLYTAPPAQVVDADDNFYSWFGREWHEHYQQNQYTTAAKQMLGVMAESAWKAGRAAMLQAGNSRGTPDEQSFWDWLRDEMPTTYRWSRELEDTPENSALITKGKASALDMLSAWKGCSATMLNHSGDTADIAEPVSKRDELNSPVTPDCWIPVSERMPEVGVKVLCFPVRDEPIHASFNGQLWLQDISWSVSDESIDNVISCNVTHWMPLPEPPMK